MACLRAPAAVLPTVPPLERLRRRRSAKWSAYGPDVLPAWVAEMDYELAEPVRAAVSEAIDSGDAGYAHADDGVLAAGFAEFAGRRLRWRVDPAGVTAVPDVVVGIGELLRVLTAPGDGVIINPPVYHPFFELVGEVERRLVEVPLNAAGDLDLEAIEAAFAAGARAIVICSPHNPLGRTVPCAALERLAELAAAHDAWVLSDEIHAPLLLPGAEHVPFTSVSAAAAERGIVLTSASKAFNVAGLKCALALAEPGPARERVERLTGAALHVGHLGVLASEAAFTAGDAWLDGVIAALDSNRRLLGELLAERLPGAVHRPPQASYLAWIDLRPLDLGADPAELFLLEGRVALSPGPSFGRQGEGFVRLNFATSPALLERIVERMASAVAASTAATGEARRAEIRR